MPREWSAAPLVGSGADARDAVLLAGGDGFQNSRSIHPAQASNPARDRYSPMRRRLAEHLRTLGTRALLEAMIEIERGATVDEALSDFARLDAGMVRAIGGDRIPPAPMYLVEAA